MPDHYEILSVPRNFTAEQLKQAYREKVMQTHPDRRGGNDKDFKRVLEAYKVLSDPVKKSFYDRTIPRVETKKEDNKVWHASPMRVWHVPASKYDLWGNLVDEKREQFKDSFADAY